MASPLICVLLLHVITLNEGISVHDATQGLHVLIVKPYSAHFAYGVPKPANSMTALTDGSVFKYQVIYLE